MAKIREGVMTEADTCREFVTPRLIEAGWSEAPHAIGEQHTFTNGRVIVTGGKGWFVSPEYRTFRCRDGQASSKYLGALVKTELFWMHLQEATRGVGARRERIRPEQLLNIEIALPVLADQLKIVEILERQTPLKAKHAAIREANAALLPATLELVFGSGNVANG